MSTNGDSHTDVQLHHTDIEFEGAIELLTLLSLSEIDYEEDGFQLTGFMYNSEIKTLTLYLKAEIEAFMEE